jgi:hypothetical protein
MGAATSPNHALEAQMQMRSFLPLLGVSLFSSALTLVGALLAFPPASRADTTQQVIPVLQAQRFEVVDAAGAVRARLGVESDNSAGLAVFDGTGQARALVSLSSADTAAVQVRSPQDGRATLSALPAGTIGLGLVDPAGASRAGIGLSPDGSPVIEVGNRLQDQPSARVQLSQLADGTIGLGIVDGSGRPRVGLATAPDGTPALLLLDAAARPRAIVVLQPDGTPGMRIANEAGQVYWQTPQPQ